MLQIGYPHIKAEKEGCVKEKKVVYYIISNVKSSIIEERLYESAYSL
jgi:hypothetical protein